MNEQERLVPKQLRSAGMPDGLCCFAADLIEKQAAIIDRLPKTADGVPVVPWMSDLYICIKPFASPFVGIWNEHLSLHISTPEGDYTYYIPEMYSTREAAEAALAKEQPK